MGRVRGGVVSIEPERTADADAVRAVLREAFPTDDEADLVDELRACGALRADCSLVARTAGEGVVGYAGLVDVRVEGAPDAALVVLAPVAVAPHRQGEGVGSALVRACLHECERAGCDAVTLEGDPAFYGRFGFVRADEYGLASDLDPPAWAFQARSCRAGALDGVSGVVRHPAPFHDLP